MTPTESSYFAALNELLRQSGAGIPRLLIDLDRVDSNIARLGDLQPVKSIRIVAKSLPCAQLLSHILDKTGKQKLMVFHLPFLLQVAERFPQADVLMGKPLPIEAVRRFYSEESGRKFESSGRLQWLVDTDTRLREIVGLARRLRRRIGVSIELDIGMHRGGLRREGHLRTLLDTAREFRDEIQVTGFMGYDAHVPKAPWPRSVERSAARARERYTRFLEFAWTRYSDLEEDGWCINGAGSPTVAMHDSASPLNDVAVGSVLVKPTSFDLPTLCDFQPAAWIGAPVLKRMRGIRIPYLERLPSRGRDTLFIYGGKWMADPHFPGGLRENRRHGLSSNQQMLTVPAATELAVDDYVFLRPSQSESVLLQFGDLSIVRGGLLLDSWPVFQNAGFPMT